MLRLHAADAGDLSYIGQAWCDSNVGVQCYKDDVVAYFQACYHLKDWLKKDPASAISAADVEEFINGANCFRVAADVTTDRNTASPIGGLASTRTLSRGLTDWSSMERTDSSRWSAVRQSSLRATSYLPSRLPESVMSGGMNTSESVACCRDPRLPHGAHILGSTEDTINAMRRSKLLGWRCVWYFG